MSRLIDADALKEKLSKGTIITDDLYGMGIMAGVDHAIKILADALTIEAEPVPKWISVEDRLPESEKDILMFFPNEIGGNVVAGFLLVIGEDGRFWNAYADNGWYTTCESKPTHWMPVPEPPEVTK